MGGGRAGALSLPIPGAAVATLMLLTLEEVAREIPAWLATGL